MLFLYKPEYAENERFSFNSNFGVPKGFNDSMYMLNNKSVENRQEQKSILINTLLDMYSNQLDAGNLNNVTMKCWRSVFDNFMLLPDSVEIQEVEQIK